MIRTKVKADAWKGADISHSAAAGTGIYGIFKGWEEFFKLFVLYLQMNPERYFMDNPLLYFIFKELAAQTLYKQKIRKR